MKCPLCDHATETFIHEKTGILYYHCAHCEFMFKSAEYHQDLESQKERYNLHQNSEDNEGYQAYFRRFLDFVLPAVGKPESALDFGCGATSLLAKMIEKQGIRTEYYDPIYHPDTLDKHQTYDLIVSTEVFEHLHRPKVVFEDLLSRVKKGGYIAIQTQFHPNEQEQFKKWYYHQDPTHIVFFTPRTFQVLCDVLGCSYIADNGKNTVIIRK